MILASYFHYVSLSDGFVISRRAFLSWISHKLEEPQVPIHLSEITSEVRKATHFSVINSFPLDINLPFAFAEKRSGMRLALARANVVPAESCLAGLSENL